MNEKSTGRSRKRKCPPDEQPWEEGGEKTWSREDVSRRVHEVRCAMYPGMAMSRSSWRQRRCDEKGRKLRFGGLCMRMTSGGRVHGRKCAVFQHGWFRPCWTVRSLEGNWQVLVYLLLSWAAGAMLCRVLTTSEDTKDRNP